MVADARYGRELTLNAIKQFSLRSSFIIPHPKTNFEHSNPLATRRAVPKAYSHSTDVVMKHEMHLNGINKRVLR